MNLTRSQRLHLAIAQTLFFALIDGLGMDDEKLKKMVWKRIDRELDAAHLTREILDPPDENEE